MVVVSEKIIKILSPFFSFVFLPSYFPRLCISALYGEVYLEGDLFVYFFSLIFVLRISFFYLCCNTNATLNLYTEKEEGNNHVGHQMHVMAPPFFHIVVFLAFSLHRWILLSSMKTTEIYHYIYSTTKYRDSKISIYMSVVSRFTLNICFFFLSSTFRQAERALQT